MVCSSPVVLFLVEICVQKVISASGVCSLPPCSTHITDLTLNSRKYSDNNLLFDEGTNVEVVCFWNSGSPSVKGRLLDKNGLELKNTTKERGQIRHTFTNVSCHDAGTVTCQAQGTRTNLTARMLVKCPPKLSPVQGDVIVPNKSSAELIVSVRSHTENITNCTAATLFEQLTPGLFRRPPCKVTGVPPDLTLTVMLENVTKEDEGRWRLEITNNIGKGHMDFTVHFQEEDETLHPTIPGTEDETSHPTIPGTKDETNWYVISTAVGFFVGAIILMTVFIWKRMRDLAVKYGSGSTRQRPPAGRELSDVPRTRAQFRQDGQGRGRVSLQRQHYYMEIEDIQCGIQQPEANPADFMEPGEPMEPPKASGKAHERPERPGHAHIQPRFAHQPLLHVYQNFGAESHKQSADMCTSEDDQ